MQSLFKYELCSHPPALFESSYLPLQINKAILADVFLKYIEHQQKQPSSDVQHVLDGGALLHHLTWPQGSTYDGVCKMYIRYVTQKYGTATVIVFDSYKAEQKIKDATQLR